METRVRVSTDSVSFEPRLFLWGGGGERRAWYTLTAHAPTFPEFFCETVWSLPMNMWVVHVYNRVRRIYRDKLKPHGEET